MSSDRALPRAVVDGEWVAGVSLGATLCIAGWPTESELRAAVSAYLDSCPPERATHWLAGDVGLWEEHDRCPPPDRWVRLVGRLDEPGVKALRIWDGVEDESSWNFTVERVSHRDPARRAAYVQVQAPSDADAAQFLAHVHRLVDAFADVRSGLAGLSLSFDPASKDEAFTAAYVWAKSWLGLIVQDLNVGLQSGLLGVETIGWVTVVGNGIFDAAAPAGPPNASGVQGADVTVTRAARAMLFTVGVAPSMLCRRDPALANYRRLYAALAPVFAPPHTEFAGRFDDNVATECWRHRFAADTTW